MNITKEFIEVNCNKECPYQSTCCKVSTEVIRHNGREGVDLFIFGMGAGREESKIGRAFVGKSGKYMRSIIKYMWDKGEIFNLALTNNVRFHPMDPYGKDREPTSDEIKRCISFLHNDIVLLNPKVIVPVGKNATSTVVLSETPMGKLRGKRFVTATCKEGNIKEYPVIPTWHPSYLARNYGKYDPNGNNQFDKEFISDILLALEIGKG